MYVPSQSLQYVDMYILCKEVSLRFFVHSERGPLDISRGVVPHLAEESVHLGAYCRLDQVHHCRLHNEHYN